MSLRQAWDREAEAWIEWARRPGHDSYWRFHRQAFLSLLPAPGALTVDIGCGEGRVARDLIAEGHRVVGVDGSPVLARAARTHEVPVDTLLADAAALPLRPRCADLAVAFMSLQDVDDLDGALRDVAALLAPEGRLCLAVVHPLNSAGRWDGDRHDADAPFVVDGSYVDPAPYTDVVERDGLEMTFHSLHRSLETISRGLEGAGLAVEAIREVSADDPTDRWSRVPYFLHIRARPG